MSDIREVEIRPSGFLTGLDLKEIWAYRELLYFLTLRDIQLRYKQTVIGIFWVVLQPLVTTAIFTVIFSRYAQFDTGRMPYPAFALTGLVLWLFVHGSVTLASGSFVNHTNLVTKVYFPRIIVPISATLSGLFDLIFGLVILAFVMAYYRIMPTWQLAFAPLFLFQAMVLTASLGTLLSALNVRFRDVKFALPFFLQVWMIASPIFYPASMIGGNARYIFALNPMTGIIEGFRSAVLGNALDLSLITISAASTIVIAVISLFVFNMMEDDFADLI